MIKKADEQYSIADLWLAHTEKLSFRPENESYFIGNLQKNYSKRLKLVPFYDVPGIPTSATLFFGYKAKIIADKVCLFL